MGRKTSHSLRLKVPGGTKKKKGGTNSLRFFCGE